ncbi:heavy-metal-associated domain-containing protein [Thiorhodococcus minor]|uniref:Heavy-metal-associated domain-containing protein n=1 Tax=Thiorhodococcus minor TaxID=57489 RepID=A0A6M0JV20_9GAMM|nr:heavy-metal-associated domain-containing protein [Thiorhodococcus minor]NEV61388.1 heavy-metal-associated domain-containing protein [Thiorhodococcus minor]
MGYSDILIHIDEDLDDDSIHNLERELCNCDGVMSACVSDRRRHLMLVDFDPEGLRPSAVIREVRAQGVGAEMVGL